MPKGYAIADTAKWTNFEVIDFDLKPEAPEDITVAIEFCGICGSDLHTVSGGCTYSLGSSRSILRHADF